MWIALFTSSPRVDLVAVGCGLWAMGYGLWAMGCGAMDHRKLQQELEPRDKTANSQQPIANSQ